MDTASPLITGYDEPLLPKEMIWISCGLPVAISFLVVEGLTQMSLPAIARSILSVYIPTLSQVGFAYLAYAHVVPRIFQRVQGRLERALIHMLFVLFGSLLVALLVHPLHNLACGRQVPVVIFVSQSVVISAAAFFPALAVQAWRVKARRTELAALHERRAAIEAQLSALQARTNPHFFFNSLNTVASLIPVNPNLAERTLERIADLLRYTLASSSARTVPLQRELDIVQDYLAIQKARFGERLKVIVEVDTDVFTQSVPPLCLQPLVENAILHGLHDRPTGSISIRAYRSESALVLEVEDDGPGPSGSAHEGSRTSVRELDQRLKLVFGDKASCGLTTAAEGGCLARIQIPLS